MGNYSCLRRRLEQQQHCHCRVSFVHHHELVDDAWGDLSVSSFGGWYSARSGNTVSRKTTCVAVMSLPLRSPCAVPPAPQGGSRACLARCRGGCTCLRAAPTRVLAVHQGGAHMPGRTSG
eukprot:6178961-Pleurochrysis_carterae.AAC.3